MVVVVVVEVLQLGQWWCGAGAQAGGGHPGHLSAPVEAHLSPVIYLACVRFDSSRQNFEHQVRGLSSHVQHCSSHPTKTMIYYSCH